MSPPKQQPQPQPQECQRRTIPQPETPKPDSFVCVCTATHCDWVEPVRAADLEPIGGEQQKKTIPIVFYTTDKANDRLTKRITQFGAGSGDGGSAITNGWFFGKLGKNKYILKLNCVTLKTINKNIILKFVL